MRVLIAIMLLCVPSLAGAQVSPVLPQLSIDTSGSEKRLSVYDPDKLGSDKLQSLFKKKDGVFVPILPKPVLDDTVVDSQTIPYSLDLYNNTGAQKTGRIVKTVSRGEHKASKRTGTTFQHTYDGHGISGNSLLSAKAADTTMACTIFQQDWLTSKHPGEGDCLELFGRVGYGDSVMLHGNGGTVRGFGALTESVTNAFKGGPYVDGAPRCTNGGDILRAVGLQDGVVNTREVAAYGHVVIARANACPGFEAFDVGYQVQNDAGGNSYWVNAFANSYNSVTNFRVDGRTGLVESYSSMLARGDVFAGLRSTGTAALQVGANRTVDGASVVNLYSTAGSSSTASATITRAPGVDGVLDFNNAGTAAMRFMGGGVEKFRVDVTGTLTTGTLRSTGNLAIGVGAAGDIVGQIGQGRTGCGSSSLDLITAAGDFADARLIRNCGANADFLLKNTGTGVLAIAAPSGTVNVSAGGLTRMTATGLGIAFNGSTPVAKQTIAAAFANPAAATNEQLAVAYNSLRAALVNLGLVQ